MNVLLNLLSGGLLKELRLAYEARLRAKDSETDYETSLMIEGLHAQIEVTRGYLGSIVGNILLLLAGFGPAFHFLMVCLDSVFDWPMVIHKLPAPMDEWQGWIVLSILGVIGMKGVFNGRR